MQELFPGVRTNGIAEQRLVSTFLETVGPAILLICIANRQVSNRGECIVDNGIVMHGRSYYFITPAVQSDEQLLEMLMFYNHLAANL